MAAQNPFDKYWSDAPDNGFNDPDYPVAEPPPEPPPELAEPAAADPNANPFDKYWSDFEQPVAAEPEPQPEHGYFANLWAGLRERGAELIGNTAGGVETLGQNMEDAAGVLDWVPQLGGIVHQGGWNFDYLNPQEWQEYSQRGGNMLLRDIAEDWNSVSYGFTPSAEENWELMKSSPDFMEKILALGAFAVETGVVSLADMAGAVAMPAPYLVSRTEEMGQERAVQQGRPGEPTAGDMAVGFTAAAIITAMERLGFESIASAFIKGGSAPQKILKGFVGEASTEFVQEQIEYGAETYGTPTEEAMTREEYALASLERGFQGAAGGGPVGAAGGAIGAVLGPKEDEVISDDVKTLEENRDAITRALNEQAAEMEVRGVIRDDRELLESEQQAAELAIQREADEIDAREQTYKSAAHAELKLQQLEKKYGETRLFPSQLPDGTWILESYGMHSARQGIREHQERLGIALRPAEEGGIEVEEIGEVATEPSPTTEGIEVSEDVEQITLQEPEGIEVEPLPAEEIEMKGGTVETGLEPVTPPIDWEGKTRGEAEREIEQEVFANGAEARRAADALAKQYAGTTVEPVQTADGEWKVLRRGKASIERVRKERAAKSVGDRPTEAPMEVQEAEEIELEGEPAPTTEGIEVAEGSFRSVTPDFEDSGEALPQIEVEELTEEEAGIEQVEGSRKIYPGREKPPVEPPPPDDDDEGPGGGGAAPILPQIVNGSIAQGRQARRGIQDEIDQVEGELKDIPSDINIDAPDADQLMDKAHNLRIKRRDLLDEQKYRVTAEEAKQARKELWEKLREAGERVNRYETIEEMRARLGRRNIDTVTEASYKRVVDTIAQAEEEGETPTVEYIQEKTGLNPRAAKRYLDRYNREVMEAEPDTTPLVSPETPVEQTQEVPDLFNTYDNVGDGAMAFAREFISLTEPDPDVDDQYLYEGATIEIEPDGENGVRIANIEALERGKGAGTRAMKMLTDLADKHQVVLTLEPVAFALDRGGESTGDVVLNQEQLVAWYEKLGFEYMEEYENTMARQPKGAQEHPKVPGRMDTDVLPDGSVYDLSKSAETQIATTTPTYDKVKGHYYKNVDNKDILDYGAGKGMAAQKHGFESLEPYPNKWTPTYQSTYRIRRQFAGIIMNNVLNVLPKHTRRAVLWDAAEKLRPGGTMYINVRSRSDVMSTTVIEKKFNDSEILTGRGTYQKGFQQQELINFIQDVLGPDYTVEKAEFGSISVLVTKSSRLPIDEPVSAEEAAAAAAETEVEGREAVSYRAQVAALNFVDSNPAFVGLKLSHQPGDKRFGKRLDHYYGDLDRTEGADGDPVDVILNDDFEIGKEYPIFIANIEDTKTGEFEQHKVLAGFDSYEAAEAGVVAMYGQQVGDISEISANEFTSWRNSNQTLQPFDQEFFRGRQEKAQDLRKPAEGDTVLDPAELATANVGPIDSSPWLLADGSIVEGGEDHLDYVRQRGVETDGDRDLRGVSRMQLEGGAARAAFFYDEKTNEAVAYLHLHDDQGLTEEQLDAIEKYTKTARKAGRKPKILIGTTPTYDPDEAPTSFNPAVAKVPMTRLRKEYGKRWAKYRTEHEKFMQGLSEKTANYVRAAVKRWGQMMRPNPAKDDLITYLRKLGGINVNIGGDWRGRLTHLNMEHHFPGLESIEKTDGTGLPLDEAALAAYDADYIPAHDADLLADLLEKAEMGTRSYSMQNQEWYQQEWDAHQEEARERHEAEAKREGDDFVENLGEPTDQLDEEMARLMAEASLLDEKETKRIVNPEWPLPPEDIKEQLRRFINDRKSRKTEEQEGRETEGEVPRQDAGVETEATEAEDEGAVSDRVRQPEQAPDVSNYERVEEYPWQELAQAAGVEILEPPSPDFEGPRTFIIDVYSDKERTKFVKQVFAANYFRYRDVERAFLARHGPFQARLQDRDEFIEISKLGFVSANEPYALHEHILEGNLKKPYRNLKSIQRIEAEEAKYKKKRPVQESGWLSPGQWSSTIAAYTDDLMAHPDPRLVVNHTTEESKKKGAPRNYISHKEGRQRVQEWKDRAKEIGRRSREGDLAKPNSQRIILSLFDATGEWVQPWIDAGYDVRAIDLKRDDMDIMDIDYQWLLDMGFLEGEGIWGILAACPCTDFAGSGARDWKPGRERPSAEGGKDFIGETHRSIDLVNQTLALIDFLKPRFWALENPIGRIRKVTNAPEPRLTFNPNNYGDPYTKKTQLYGNFNANLPTANVDPREEHGGQGSKMHKLGSKDELDGGLRSVTPEGFAYAFFMANNDVDYPIVQEIADQAKRSLDPKVKEADPNIERKVELLTILTLSEAYYKEPGKYWLKETDNFPDWAKQLIEEMQGDVEEDWRLTDGKVLTTRELEHMDQELRSLLEVGQRGETKYPPKEAIELTPVESLNEIGGPYAEEDYSSIDPYMMEAAVDGVNLALQDLAEQGYTYDELKGEPRIRLPDALADPLGVIIDVASGAIPVARALKAVKSGDRRTKPETAFNRLANWMTAIENANGRKELSFEELKNHVREEYPFLANALDASYSDPDDGGVAMRRQAPDSQTIKSELAESLGRADLAWGPIETDLTPPTELGPPPPVPERGPAETEGSWAPVETQPRPPEVDINGVLETSAEGQGEPLANIALTATVGDRSVTHNAQWFRKAIDERLEKLNRIRGCA